MNVPVDWVSKFVARTVLDCEGLWAFGDVLADTEEIKNEKKQNRSHH